MLRDNVLQKFDPSGILYYFDGNMYFYDPVYEKTLSVEKYTISFSVSSKLLKNEIWLRLNNIPSNLSPFFVENNITITSLKSNCSSGNPSFKIFSVDSTSEIEIEIFQTIYPKEQKRVNIDLPKNKMIKVLVDPLSFPISYPSLTIEYSKRIPLPA